MHFRYHSSLDLSRSLETTLHLSYPTSLDHRKRPKPAVEQDSRSLQCGPPKPPFTAAANLGVGGTNGLRTKSASVFSSRITIVCALQSRCETPQLNSAANPLCVADNALLGFARRVKQLNVAKTNDNARVASYPARFPNGQTVQIPNEDRPVGP